MKKQIVPTYVELERILSKTALKLHPSQVHGLISGIICGNPTSTAAWEELITGGKDTGKTHDLLQQLYDMTVKQLDEFLFEFQLMLPQDSEALSVRAEALTVWCQGFLTGLKLAQVQLVAREPGETTEAINDIIEIAKMNYEEVKATEEDEEAFFELTEYVRMAVILIYQDLREQDASKKSSSHSNHLH